MRGPARRGQPSEAVPSAEAGDQVQLALDVIEICRTARRGLEREVRDAKAVGDAKALLALDEQKNRMVRLLNWAVMQAESPHSASISTEISKEDSNARRGGR